MHIKPNAVTLYILNKTTKYRHSSTAVRCSHHVHLTPNNSFEFDNTASSDSTHTRKFTATHINHIQLARMCQTNPPEPSKLN